MECCLTVRAAEQILQWNLDEWQALVMLGAVSTDPYTTAELLDAMRRYLPHHTLDESSATVVSLDDAARGEAWCLIDLVGRTIVSGGDFELPEPRCTYEPTEGDVVEGFANVWFIPSAAWQCFKAQDDWQAIVGTRARRAIKAPPLDVRASLYGPALWEFLATRVLEAARKHRGRDDAQELKLTRTIHAQWLLTPRDELRGQTPRQLLLADRDRLETDMEMRCRQWSRQGSQPHGLAVDSQAFRFSGFGTVEIVVYFELVRCLLQTAWQYVDSAAPWDKRDLVERLEQCAAAWMERPYDETMDRSARELIELERRRIPLTQDPRELDCDCPICRAEADGLFGGSPLFTWFDGSHLELEEEFAFSLTESYDEWKSNQGAWQPGGNQQLPGGQELVLEGASDEPEGSDELSESVWKASYVNWSHISAPKELLFSLAFPLAELISDLKREPQGAAFVKRLNEAYDDLRRATEGVAIESAAQHLIAVLEEVSRQHSTLTSKCADLQSHLDEFQRSVKCSDG